MYKPVIRKVFYLSTLLLLFACSRSIVKYELPAKNPTSYVFKAGKEQLKELIENRAHFKCTDLTMNENDCEIYGCGDLESKIYYRDKKPMKYWTAFKLYFFQIEPLRTLVVVKTFNSHIVVGESFLNKFSSYIGHAFFDLEEVEPSTIEEYEILLEIGRLLGVQDSMPKLILPIYDSKNRKKFKRNE